MLSCFRSLCILVALASAGCATAPSPPPPATASAPETTPAVIAAEPASTEAQVIASVELEYNVFFERGSTEVDEVGEALLSRHAERLKANRKECVTLIGHTENLGSRAYSVALADERVEVVYALLRKFGVSSRQLRRSSAGMEKTRKACQSQACRPLMRRVELKYSKLR
jgi:outer membrane protein OmpA-like peptidoglycan-associated protein